MLGTGLPARGLSFSESRAGMGGALLWACWSASCRPLGTCCPPVGPTITGGVGASAVSAGGTRAALAGRGGSPVSHHLSSRLDPWKPAAAPALGPGSLAPRCSMGGAGGWLAATAQDWETGLRRASSSSVLSGELYSESSRQ